MVGQGSAVDLLTKTVSDLVADQTKPRTDKNNLLKKKDAGPVPPKQTPTTDSSTFKIPYQNEISEINPLSLRSASGSYIHQALFRNLFWINEQNELKPDLAESCRWQNEKSYHCKIKKNLKWSTGAAISAKDFFQTYEFILNPKSNFSRKEMLFTIKNAREYAFGEISDFEKVGIRQKDAHTIEFSLSELDPEFEYKLALPMTAPVRQNNFNMDSPIISSGPYRIKYYDSKSLEIRLESNPFYHVKSTRPEISFTYIADDSVQIPLFTKRQIDLVRRVPTSQIPEWKKHESFRSVEVLRFDYFGFNLEKLDKPIRQSMSEVIDYKELQELFNSVGRPGCFDFSNLALDKPLCIETKNQKKKLVLTTPTLQLEMIFSLLGGEDHLRAGEWLRSQWKTYLNLDVSIRQQENKVFLNTLKTNLPTLFRKGIPLETPLCYSAVKLFEESNPENLNKISDPFLNSKIAQLKKEFIVRKQKALCLEILKHVKDEFLIIPTGRYELSILLREPYKNLRINKLNMIDFSQY